MPVRLVWGLSKTRKAAKLAVYEATMIIANPAQTIPKTLAEKLRGVPEKERPFFTHQVFPQAFIISTFAYAWIEQDTPSKPNGAGEVERLLFLHVISAWISRFESTKRRETIQKVQAQSYHMHGDQNQYPQGWLEWL